MNNYAIRYIIGLGSLTITGIFIVQLYWLQKAFDVENRQFTQTVHIALNRVSEQLQKNAAGDQTPLQPASELSSNFYVVNFNGTIDTSLLSRCLKKELLGCNIQADVEYGVYDSSSHKMLYGTRLLKNFKGYDKDLPVLNRGNYYVGIFFPGKNSQIAGAMGVWIFSTFLLLMLVAFFSYALMIILKQRRFSEVQKDFVNNMTHEFKTPLSSISLSAVTLRNHPLISGRSEVRIIAEIIEKETQRLDHQVERVLQMSNSSRSTITLVKEKTDLHEIIHDVISQCKETIFKERKIQSVLRAVKPWIYVDRMHLRNVIINLFDNAVKYSSEGTTIKIITEFRDNGLHLEIEDKGTGIAFIHQKKIFEPFYRVPTGNIHNVRGFGLGLNYIKNIARAHRWKISLFSRENEGTCFSINFRN